jgi:photosystem II stability/assembly factor-like uncharacterized protein
MKNKVILPSLLLASLLLGSCAPAASSSVQDFKFENLSFRFDTALAESVHGEIVPSGEMEIFGFGDHLPEHLAVMFSGYYPERTLDPKTLNDDVGAQIFVYPTANWWPASDWLSPPEVFPNLKALLADRPEAPELPIPTLPIWPHTQVFRSQVKYLDFQNGNGVRFITQYAVEAIPVTNREIFYSFQGLTQDGTYYVAAYFPLAAAGLDDEPVVEDWEAFNAGYQNYLTETLGHLNALSSDEFEPKLDLLDAVIQSLVVDTSKAPVDVYGQAIPRLAAGDSVDLSAVAMQDLWVGWAIGGSGGLGDHLLTTEDGGYSWRDVTPPEPAEPTEERVKMAAGSFLDTKRAWATYFYVPLAENGIKVPTAPIVWRTQDGGFSWNASEPLSLGDDPISDYRITNLQFVDEANGWLLAHVGGMQPNGVVLFHSQDGGKTWERLLDPSSAYLQDCGNIRVHFKDAEVGWATGSCDTVPSAYLKRTDDAGRNWQVVELPAPTNEPDLWQSQSWTCMTQSLHFPSPQDGFLTAGCNNNSFSDFRAVLWSTHDGGESWQAALLPGIGSLGLINTDTGWLLDSSNESLGFKLHKTEDGGESWTMIASLDWNTTTPLEALNFVDELNGWVTTVGEVNGALALTRDGGVTWEIIDKPVVVR